MPKGMRGWLLFSLFFMLRTAWCQSPYFSEVSSSLGIDYIYPGNDFQMDGGGVMVIDVNNDGWEDVLQSGGVFDSKLWLNERGTFRDATKDFGLDKLIPYFVQSAVSADFNNDGFSDFIIVNFGKGMERGDKKSPLVLLNKKGKSFDTLSLHNILEPAHYTSACVGDVNKDGFTDIYLTNYVDKMGGIYDSNGVEIGYNPRCYENKLLMNVKGKSFVESASKYGVNDLGCGLSASLTDADMDGDLDLLLLNDFGPWSGYGNRFFRNEYPAAIFKDQSDLVGINQQIYGMGIGQGDYDNDGDLDYYVTNIGKNYLFNNQQGKFIDLANEEGVDLTYVRDSLRGTSWSGLFFDRENDGDLDLFVSKGNVLMLLPKTAIKDKNAYFERDSNRYINQSDRSGLDDVLSHRGSAMFDVDHDGDLDIVSGVIKLPLAAFANLEQKIKLFRNEAQGNSWIGVELVGSSPINKDCFGCSATLISQKSKTIREVEGGSGHGAQSSRILYFGLGTNKDAEKIQLRWADGTTSELSNLRGGHVYKVYKNGKMTVKY